MRLAVDPTLKKIACPVIQAELKCDYKLAHMYPLEDWSMFQTPGMVIKEVDPDNLQAIFCKSQGRAAS